MRAIHTILRTTDLVNIFSNFQRTALIVSYIIDHTRKENKRMSFNSGREPRVNEADACEPIVGPNVTSCFVKNLMCAE